MFCRNCGNQMANETVVCTRCGVTPPKGDKFCQNCGSATDPLADVCIRCGVKLARPTAPPQSGKSKLTAVLLAVFLSFWTWLYTYKRNAWKFWTGMAVMVVLMGLMVWATVVFFANVGQYRGSDFPPELVAFLVIFYGGGFVGFGIWLWAVLDTVLKNEDWYRSY